jgi:uncharacterized membrane protein
MFRLGETAEILGFCVFSFVLLSLTAGFVRAILVLILKQRSAKP